MPGFDEGRSAQTRPARSAGWPVEDELSEAAIRAMEEGRADHAASRTFTMAEIRREFGIGSPWRTDFTDTGGATVGAHDA